MKNKKVLFISLIVVIILSSVVFAEASTSNIIIKINGEVLDIPEEYGKPFINNDSRTMIPIRIVSEELGYFVSFSQTPYTQWVDINTTSEPFSYENRLGLEIGYSIADTNIGDIRMDAAPIIINDRTYVPMRFIAESLGYDVNYEQPNSLNGFNHTIDIIKDGDELLVRPNPARLVEREHDLYYLKERIKSGMILSLSVDDQPGNIDFIILHFPSADNILEQYEEIKMILEARFGNDPVIDKVIDHLKAHDGKEDGPWPVADFKIQDQSISVHPSTVSTGNIKVWNQEAASYFIKEGMDFDN